MNTALIVLIIIGVILLIIAITINFKDERTGYYIFGLGLGILISVTIIEPIHVLSVHPIDVYRGKTTLEITYKDNIPIDSVVVYKNK